MMRVWSQPGALFLRCAAYSNVIRRVTASVHKAGMRPVTHSKIGDALLPSACEQRLISVMLQYVTHLENRGLGTNVTINVEVYVQIYMSDYKRN